MAEVIRHHPRVIRGTAAERAAYDTTLTQSAVHWVEEDTEDIYVWDGSAWDGPLGAGGGAPHNILSATHPDANVAAVVRADLIVGDAAPTWARLAKGNAADILRINAAGADIAWETEFDAVVPTTIQADDAAAAGVAVVAARRDHAHGFPTVTPVETGTANAEGILYDFVRCDHVHKLHDHLHAGVAGDGAQLDHGNAMIPASLGDDDHTIYLLAAGTRDLTGDMNIDDGLGNSPMLYWVGGAGGSGYIYFMDTPNTLAIYIMDNVAQGWTIRDKGSPEEYLTVVSTDGTREVVVNEDGDQYIDFRVEGNTDTHLLFVDAGLGRVGIGDPAPACLLEVNGAFMAKRMGLNAAIPNQDGVLAMTETADPANVATVGMLYAQDDGGITRFRFARDDGDIFDVGLTVEDVTVTVKAAGGDFTTIQAAIDWFGDKLALYGDNYINADAAAYDEAVQFASILLAPGATLTLQGDMRALAGMSFADGVDINKEGRANGGDGVGTLSNAGNVITVVGAVTNPDFGAGGWANGDEVLVFDNAGTITKYTISTTLNNTITLTVAAPNVGNDSTVVCLLPNRSIARTVAGPCIDIVGCNGIRIWGWYLDTATGADCHGIYVRSGATVFTDRIATLAEDYGLWVRAGSSVEMTAPTSLFGPVSGSIGCASVQTSYVYTTYAIACGGSIGFLAQDLSFGFYRYCAGLNMLNYAFYAYYFGFVDSYRSWARRTVNTGYYGLRRGYIFAMITNANNNNIGADYSAATDVWHNNNASITWT